MIRYVDLYVTLLDEGGNQVGAQQYVQFEMRDGVLANLQSIEFISSTNGAVRRATLHASPGAPALFSLEMKAPISTRTGDTLRFAPAGIKVHGEGDPSVVAWLSATQSVPDATFEQFTANNPEASLKEVWEAAFVAGSRVAHILLTGDAP